MCPTSSSSKLHALKRKRFQLPCSAKVFEYNLSGLFGNFWALGVVLAQSLVSALTWVSRI